MRRSTGGNSLVSMALFACLRWTIHLAAICIYMRDVCIVIDIYVTLLSTSKSTKNMKKKELREKCEKTQLFMSLGYKLLCLTAGRHCTCVHTKCQEWWKSYKIYHSLFWLSADIKLTLASTFLDLLCIFMYVSQFCTCFPRSFRCRSCVCFILNFE